jgi:DNA ligase (NAD+)
VTGGVSAQTTALFAGAEGGSKLRRAEELGIPVLGEADLLALISSAG